MEPSAKSLNSGDVFVLVTPKEIHLWSGKDASIMKKAKVTCQILSKYSLESRFLEPPGEQRMV